MTEPYVLWDQFKTGLCDDIKHKIHHMNYYQADQEIPEDDIYDYGLWYYKLHLAISPSFI